jgi:hypothetical protein
VRKKFKRVYFFRTNSLPIGLALIVERDARSNPGFIFVEIDAHHFALAHPDGDCSRAPDPCLPSAAHISSGNRSSSLPADMFFPNIETLPINLRST